MKTIFRYANIAVLMAALIVLGTVAGFAQDPCADAEGQTALGDKFRAEFADKTIAGRKKAIETGKQFLEKYGSCESAAELADYLKTQLPKFEQNVKEREAKELEDKRVARFDAALKTKNWDEIYPAGKDLLDNYGDKYRDVELALGTIGYDEFYNKNNSKYNEETLKYARMAISDLESGKTFSADYGIKFDFLYKSRENAIGWMNLIVGYITSVAQKNRSAALPYLFRASQSTSTAADSTAKNPIPYEMIGRYYFGEIDKLVEQYQAKVAAQSDTDTPEVAKAKVDDIKATVAMLNGTLERAMDAFSRAYTLGSKPDYKAQIKKFIDDAYKRRFVKTEGVDAWIAAAVKKPFVNPATPVAPISDPEPDAPATTTTATPTTTTAPTNVPAVKSGQPSVKPPTAPAKPVSTTTTKPAAITKPQATVKKTTVKKKGA